MKNLEVGSFIEFIGDDEKKTVLTEEVLGICGKIVFTRPLLEKGVGPANFYEIEDLETYGWKVK